MNKIILSGNLVKDIEIRQTTSGKSVIQNTIAVRNDFANKDGNYDSTFLNIVVWGAKAEYLNKYAEKGSKILVEGKISNRNYEAKDGTKKYITEVIVEKLEIITFKKEKTTISVDLPNTYETQYDEIDEKAIVDTVDLPF